MLEFLKRIKEEGLSPKLKKTIAIVLGVIVIVGGIVGYKMHDYVENDPSFCKSCHLMDDAYNRWQASVHNGINCHECHHLTFKEQNMLLVNLVLHNPEEVAERPAPTHQGHMVVPDKYCVGCHWEVNEKFPNATKVNTSPIHAKHYFMNQIPCSRCHGSMKIHQFRVDPQFCADCHTDKVKVHGEEAVEKAAAKGKTLPMQNLACLNCHTDAKMDLMPTRSKCLSCHGSAEQRAAIAKAPVTGDTKLFGPTPEDVEAASGMTVFPEDAPMQFDCSRCHNPHEKMKLEGNEDCMVCHAKQTRIGMHGFHIDDMGAMCIDCHQPHSWRATPEVCANCHGAPRNISKFLD